MLPSHAFLIHWKFFYCENIVVRVSLDRVLFHKGKYVVIADSFGKNAHSIRLSLVHNVYSEKIIIWSTLMMK